MPSLSVVARLDMEQKNAQIQTQATVQQQSAMQVMLASLVGLPVMALGERVAQELTDNEALEESDGPEDYDQPAADTETDGYDGADDMGGLADTLGDYANEDETPAYLREQADAEAERRERPLSGGTSALEALKAQMGEHHLTARQCEIVDWLIGSLDDHGYLNKDADTLADELAIYQGVDTTPQEVETMIAELQTFEPRGIGARSLQECLRLQLEDPDFVSEVKTEALQVVNLSFADFTSRRWDAIAARHGFDAAMLERVKKTLTHLNPRPASLVDDEVPGVNNQPVIPDFRVIIDAAGRPEVQLNDGDVPELRISRSFRDSLSALSKNKKTLTRQEHDTYIYIRAKVESAQTFINLINRRRQTLLAVMQAIVDMQTPYFVNDDDEALLEPMTQSAVAQRAGVDISTVSRVVNSKYVETDYGTYPLKFFFSTGFTSAEGEEVAARKVQAAIRDLVAAEDKAHPLSDEAIARRLSEMGLPAARRTVAKYRDLLHIPVARLRRE